MVLYPLDIICLIPQLNLRSSYFMAFYWDNRKGLNRCGGAAFLEPQIRRRDHMERQNLSIGTVAARTGLSVSAIRFYEERGLVTPGRNLGGQRRFQASDIRRLSFIMITQQLGFSIDEISTQLASLPNSRTPTQKDWTRMSEAFRDTLDLRIRQMTRLRDRLDGCIGCGCLSLEKCALYNKEDRAKKCGAGPRFVIDD